MVRIFHTADVHLGLKFVRASLESHREKLVEARLSALSRMVEVAMQEKCDLLVIAGDLFDSVKVQKPVVRKAAEILRRFDGMVVVLPGNHDFVQERSEDDLWINFAEVLGDQHLVLRESRAYDLRAFDLPLVLYAGPCTTRHSSENAIGWVKAARENDPGDHIRVGIAPGSLDGLSPDFSGDYFPMTRQELHQSNLHAWLLGHTHVRFPDKETGSGDRIFYPSVPEPDGFDCHHGGSAWVIELASDGEPVYRSVPIGAFQFHDLKFTIDSEADLDRLYANFSKLDRSKDLVKLELVGRLEGELFAQLPTRIQGLETCVLHLETCTSGLLRLIQQNDIDREFTEGSFPHRLLSELSKDPEDQLALQIAHEMVDEARS